MISNNSAQNLQTLNRNNGISRFMENDANIHKFLAIPKRNLDSAEGQKSANISKGQINLENSFQGSPEKDHKSINIMANKSKLFKPSVQKKRSLEEGEERKAEKIEKSRIESGSPLKDLNSNKKSQNRFKDTFNATAKSMLFRDTTSNSPLKQKILLKSPRDLNDIDIDKESLMQLNRATNQFFSKKVKETIQNSMLFQKPGSSERRNNNSSLDDTTFSIKSLDNKEKIKETGLLIRILKRIS